MYNDMHQLEHYQMGAMTHLSRSYDDNGNTTRHWDNDGSAAFDWTYTWSEDNRMTLAHDTVGGTKIRYTYDWQGRRLEREDETSSSNGPKRRYYIHGLTPIWEQGGTYVSQLGGYVWGSGARYNTLAPGQYGHIVVQRDVTTDVFLHYDHVGNVVAESNTSGAFAALHEQDAFGRPVLSSAASGWDDNSTLTASTAWEYASALALGAHGSCVDLASSTELRNAGSGYPITLDGPVPRLRLDLGSIDTTSRGCSFINYQQCVHCCRKLKPHWNPQRCRITCRIKIAGVLNLPEAVTGPHSAQPPHYKEVPNTPPTVAAPPPCVAEYWNSLRQSNPGVDGDPCGNAGLSFVTCLAGRGLWPADDVVSLAGVIADGCRAEGHDRIF
jgi:YD repeat-containing protein